MLKFFYDSFDEFIYMRRAFALNGILVKWNGEQVDAADYTDTELLDEEHGFARVYLTEEDLRVIQPQAGDVWRTVNGHHFPLHDAYFEHNAHISREDLVSTCRLVERGGRPVIYPRVEGRVTEGKTPPEQKQKPEQPKKKRKIFKGLL